MSGRKGLVAAAVAAALMLLPSLARADDPLLVAVGAGDIDFDHTHPAAEFRGELRFPWGYWLIKPLVGAFGTSRGATYVYGGFRIDLIFADHYVIMPDAAVGWYQRGNGKNSRLAGRVQDRGRIRLPLRQRGAARHRLRPHLECRPDQDQSRHRAAPGDAVLAVLTGR